VIFRFKGEAFLTEERKRAYSDWVVASYFLFAAGYSSRRRFLFRTRA
jgi:hypothetical protein